MENKAADDQYKLIPMDEITPEARRIAVAWIDNYVPHGSIMPEIAQKQKLASDIMNYASLQCAEMKEELESWKKEHFETVEMAAANIKEMKEEVERLRKENTKTSALLDLASADARLGREEVERLTNLIEKAKDRCCDEMSNYISKNEIIEALSGKESKTE